MLTGLTARLSVPCRASVCRLRAAISECSGDCTASAFAPLCLISAVFSAHHHQSCALHCAALLVQTVLELRSSCVCAVGVHAVQSREPAGLRNQAGDHRLPRLRVCRQVLSHCQCLTCMAVIWQQPSTACKPVVTRACCCVQLCTAHLLRLAWQQQQQQQPQVSGSTPRPAAGSQLRPGMPADGLQVAWHDRRGSLRAAHALPEAFLVLQLVLK